MTEHPKKSDRFCQYLAEKTSDDSVNILKKTCLEKTLCQNPLISLVYVLTNLRKTF